MCEQPYVSGYPYIVVSLEKGVRIDEHPLAGHSGNTIYLADPSLITLYKSRAEGEKAELEKLHTQHLTEKRELRKQEKRVKLANKRIGEYKKFKQIQTVYE
jgi:predicted double-glycine peptidase